MAAVLYIHNSPATILHLAVVRRLNNFSAHTDPTKNRILKNWSQSCGIRCHLCWVLCWGWGVIIVIFSLDVYIFHSGAVQKLGFKLLSDGYF